MTMNVGTKVITTGHRFRVGMSLAALMVAGGFVSTARAQTIYWTNDGIHRVLASGENIQELHAAVSVLSMALDADAGKMYWINRVDHALTRANLDGSNVEDLVTTEVYNPFGMAVDPTGGKVYWTDGSTAGNYIRRASLDGSSVESLIANVGFPHGIGLDTVAGKMYWSRGQGPNIQRANLDGSSVELAVVTQGIPWGIAIDVAGGKIYWTVPGGGVNSGQIWRANLNGSSTDFLVAIAGGDPKGIALDVAGGKMYWADIARSEIARANLDGSNVETVVDSTSEGGPLDPWDIAIQFTVCGDGVVEGAEACDDTGVSATCEADCTLAVCGDGTLNTLAGEECDDGPDNSNTEPDACRTTCVLPSCGDGAVDTGEACDDGNSSNQDSCLNDCVPNVCGDGFRNIWVEECDDGNTVPGDGCTETCVLEPGACCLGTACSIVSEPECLYSGGTFFGFNTACNVPDADGDGLRDECDGCPFDANKIEPGLCGCGLGDNVDSDGDGVADCIDQCPGVDDTIFLPGCLNAFPTVSEWGLVVITLLLLAGIKIKFGGRQPKRV